MMYSENPLRGALLMTLAALMFASMGACIKRIAPEVPNEVVVFLRNLFGFLYLLPWLLRGGVHALVTQRPGMHLIRSLAGLAAMYSFFYALAHLELANAVLLNFSTPLFVPIFAFLWLGEAVPRSLKIAIVTGFIGIGLILKPDTGLFHTVALIGLASGIFAAFANVCIRRMSNTEPTTRIVFYYSLICTVVSAVPMAWAWQAPASPSTWGLLVAIGVLATSGQLLMTRAFAHAPAARVGPFMYTAVVFAAVFGWLFWIEVPDALSFAGALLVVIAGSLAVGYQQGRPRP